MPSALSLLMFAVSVFVLWAITLWHPRHRVACLSQIVVLALLALVADSGARIATVATLAVVSTAFVLLGRHEKRLTPGACAATWIVTMIVSVRYPPSWTLAIVFLLGWAHFAGLLGQWDSPRHNESKPRDTTDLYPLIAIILLGAALIDAGPTVVALAVFGTLSFIVNDVLASELGPSLPGSARMLPRTAAVPHGTPGAMSDGGTILGMVGSACAGLCVAALLHDVSAGGLVAFAGAVASFTDSALSRTRVLSAVPRGHELVNSVGCLIAIVVSVLPFAR